ncbi:hypothetical protein GCM10011533_07780 [Streptosporangium jomthongense]|uniref:Helix-turn-helix domain-containing protein n=1 Tax=Marinobacter aromaticivorans TaxID=1494078 RepID=A0ABW2ISE1_9GAMM|nr:helix-turn-helix transcriptional regulator [Marinobacter aromaticivorans]GGE57721.1 hypothetical protein GCM10011533_07780 [Streptosporangium jomthongense]
MKTKQGLLAAVQQEIRNLQSLAERIESSEEPDLRPLSELAPVLKNRRETLRLSAQEVSDLAGLSPNTYRAMEIGNANPTIQTLQVVGKVLNFRLWIELK